MSFPLTNNFWQSLVWLLTIVLITELVSFRWQDTNSKRWQSVFGIILGCAGVLFSIAESTNPFIKLHYELYALGGTFFGPLATFTAIIINAIYYAVVPDFKSILIIFAVGLLGIIWSTLQKHSPDKIHWQRLILLVLFAHGVTLTISLGFNWNTANQFLDLNQLVYSFAYPIITFLVGGSCIRQLKRNRVIQELLEQSQKMVRSEELYRILTESMKDVVWILDTETMHFTYISPSVEKLRGYTPEEIIVQPATAALTPEAAENLKENITVLSAAFKSGRLPKDSYFTEDIEQPCKDGSTVWTEAITAFAINSETNHVEVRGVTRDISARKRAEQEKEKALIALRESVDSFRQIFEHAADGILIINQKGQILRVNNSACRVLGYMPDEIQNINFSDLVIRPFDWASSEYGENVEISMRCKNGNLLDVEINYQILPDGRVQIMARDISKRKQADEEIRQAYTKLKQMINEKDQSRLALLSMVEDLRRTQDQIQTLNIMLEQRVAIRTVELEASNKELEAFAYSVSHDLRAPLRAIDGFSQILESEFGPKLDDEAKRLIGIIRSSSKKMDHLIQDLLALSRVSRAQLTRIPVDMNNLAKTVYYELASAEVQTKTSLEIDLLPEANGDPVLLRQVWINLISNALKYSSPKPEIKIKISSKVENDQVVFFIQDNGVGFNPKYTSKLFGVFSRLHKPDQFEGTGVGLAIIQRIITRHGGKIWAEGVLNEGATFYFTLPPATKVD